MVLLTSKHVLVTLAAGVVGYLVLLLPALHELPVSLLIPVRVQEAFQAWRNPISSTIVGTSDDSPKNEESAEAGEAAGEEAPQPRKRTLLEQKFAIDGPELGWDVATITLDYQLAEWVTNDVLDYAFYDWECHNKLDTSEQPTGWKVMVPEMIGPVQVEVATEVVDGEQSGGSTSSGREMVSTRRMPLFPPRFVSASCCTTCRNVDNMPWRSPFDKLNLKLPCKKEKFNG